MNQFQRKILLSEEKLNKTAIQQTRKQARIIKAEQAIFIRKVDSLIVEISANPERKAAAIGELNNLVRDAFESLNKQQIGAIDQHLRFIYNKATEDIGDALGINFSVVSPQQQNLLKEAGFRGKSYSSRLYSNNEAVAKRLNDDVRRLIFENRKPSEIKAAIARDFDISINSADRLVRTETSRFFNQASNDTYAAAGIEQMEFLAERDACHVCQSKDKQRYRVGGPTPVPVHPNCRCTILPVIKK